MGTFHCKFDADGRPANIFLESRADTEPVEAESVMWLAARRRVNGEWRMREPAPPPPPPTPEELAERLAARKAVIIEVGEAELRRRILDWIIDWAMGTITQTQLRNRIQALRDAVKAQADAES